MTLPYSLSKNVFEGNDLAIEYAFTFKVWNTSELSVVVTDPDGIDGAVSGWTATLSDSGGTLTYRHNGAPLPRAWKLTILRDMPFVQTVDLISGSRFDPQVIEDQMDKAAAERQQLKEGLARTVQVAPGSTTKPSDMLNDIKIAVASAATSAESSRASADDAAVSAHEAAQSAQDAAQSEAHAKESADAASAAKLDIDGIVQGAAEEIVTTGNEQVGRVVNTGEAQVARIEAYSSLTPKAGYFPQAGELGFLSSLWGVAQPGDIELKPFRSTELPPGWYFCNADRFDNASPQAQALNALPATFKTDWGIVNNGVSTNVPTLFHTDGRGFFLRSVNGVARQVGSVEDDAIRNIVGRAGCFGFGGSRDTSSGAAWRSYEYILGASGGDGLWFGTVNIDASRVVPTGAENRPINRGMTPAIYLGV